MESIIEITSLSWLGDDLGQIKRNLMQYAEAGTVLSYDGKIVDLKVLLQFYDYIMNLNRTKLRKCQQKGIQEALKRKSEGYGSYGRPRTSLPHDFDEQIRRRLNNKESLSHYCDKIGMKKSTFYKYANRIKKTIAVEILNELKQE